MIEIMTAEEEEEIFSIIDEREEIAERKRMAIA